MTYIPRLLRYEQMTATRNVQEGQYGADGFPTVPVKTSFTIRGNVQPISGYERLQLAEGDRTRDVMWLFTTDEVRADDLITRKGTVYEIQVVEDWRQQRLSHYRCRMVRRDV